MRWNPLVVSGVCGSSQGTHNNFFGDGDTKSHPEVVAADPYPGTPVKKLECVGHVQKRCGTRLRNLKKLCKDKIIFNGKEVAVLQKLTHKCINKLQNC